MIHVSLLVESLLDEQILRRLLHETGRYAVDTPYVRGGRTQIEAVVTNFNQMAQSGYPLILLTDLNSAECPRRLIDNWLPHGCHPNLVFRVAVREVEAWLLADREGIADFLRISKANVPRDPESIPDPKRTLVDLARSSRSRQIREDIVPEPESTSRVGKDYNGRLSEYVRDRWNLEAALENSPSLARAYIAFTKFEPISE